MTGWAVPGVSVRVVDAELRDVPRDMQAIGDFGRWPAPGRPGSREQYGQEGHQRTDDHSFHESEACSVAPDGHQFLPVARHGVFTTSATWIVTSSLVSDLLMETTLTTFFKWAILNASAMTLLLALSLNSTRMLLLGTWSRAV